MGRSVATLRKAQQVFYIHIECEDEWEWDDFKSELINLFKTSYPSLCNCDKWDGNEIQVILENNNIEVAIAEYCGLVSVSLRAKEYDGYGTNTEALGIRFIERITPRLTKLINENFNSLKKVGTFSNGEGVYEKAN